MNSKKGFKLYYLILNTNYKMQDITVKKNIKKTYNINLSKRLL